MLGVNAERRIQPQIRGLAGDGWHMDVAEPLVLLFRGALQIAWNWHRTTVEPPPKEWRVPSRLLLMLGILAVGGGLWFWGIGTPWTYAQLAVYPGMCCTAAGVLLERNRK